MSDHCKSPKEKLVALGARSAAVHWRSPESRADGRARPRGEFPGGAPSAERVSSVEASEASEASEGGTRRDFLSMMGFGLATAGLAACRAPEQRAIPLGVASEDQVPGVANYYATTCGGCAASCALVVKQRDGRPIKIEGNDASERTGGATCATGQAMVLSLYDHERLHGPLWRGEPATWREIDAQVKAAIEEARAGGGKVALLSSTLHGPSTLAVIERWRREVPGFLHVMYDAVSSSGLQKAGRAAFGRELVPQYDFGRAQVVVGLDADFLGTWISPVEYARQYGRSRTPERGEHLHVQIEAGMSVTGSNADRRIPVRPSEIAPIAAALLAKVAKLAGHAVEDLPELAGTAGAAGAAEAWSDELDALAAALWRYRGLSLVVSGGNDAAVDRAVLAVNALLGNLGCTVRVDQPSQQRRGDDEATAQLVAAMERGEIHTLILHGVNPVYDAAEPERFAAALGKVRCSISTADRRDETCTYVTAVCPEPHFLEAWGDAEPVRGQLSLGQPVIAPLYDTRSFVESSLEWLGEAKSHYHYLRDFWREEIHARARGSAHFVADADRFWEETLERGVLELAGGDEDAPPYLDDWRAAWRALVEQCQLAEAARDGGFELEVVESVALRDGRHANNPWLLELPDPISKLTWGNAVAMAPHTARQLGLARGDVVKLATAAGHALELPVFLQPGQHPATLSVALGYGRQRVGKAGNRVGANAFGMAPLVAGTTATMAARQRRRWSPVSLTATGRREELATTQEHFSMEGRPIVVEIERDELEREERDELEREERGGRGEQPNLWAERPHGERAWGMTIDLSSCTGCSACVIACQAENNVPVIGKDQVQRQRIMHWIRIDRYYAGSEDNPRSVHQPMMCQHCGHAPCETVCPVLATTTSSEGLNQQTYNRCIGTRYCANNCPYKVRRFNWFNYAEKPRFDSPMTSPVARLVLNPDVAVRSRGVMEKCSLCVQRIAAAKNLAAKEARALRDGDVETACQQACPTDAIVFGDLAEPKGQVAKRAASERNYRVLEELGTRPNVSYLKKVRHGRHT